MKMIRYSMKDIILNLELHFHYWIIKKVNYNIYSFPFSFLAIYNMNNL